MRAFAAGDLGAAIISPPGVTDSDLPDYTDDWIDSVSEAVKHGVKTESELDEFLANHQRWLDDAFKMRRDPAKWKSRRDTLVENRRAELQQQAAA